MTFLQIFQDHLRFRQGAVFGLDIGNLAEPRTCSAYVHFLNIRITSQNIYGENILDRFFPGLAAYMQLMDSRPYLQKVMAEREVALAAFLELDVKYEG